MGVEFRWQVESEDEWEPPTSPPERRRRFPWRIVGFLGLLLVVGAGIGAGRFWQGVRQGEARLRRELGTAANLEAQVLRDGDRGTFLSLQDQDDPAWYARQEKRVPSWYGVADLEPGQDVNLTVLDAALLPAGNRAWADVVWGLEDGVYHRVQFYRRVEGRWLRTGTRLEHFGAERARQTAHFAFTYRARDELTVSWMAEQLEAWYETVCTDLSCDDSRRVNVLITALGETNGEHRPPNGFTLSSPRLRGVREDGAPLLEERKELAHILIYLLAARRAGDLEGGRQSYYPLDIAQGQQSYPSAAIKVAGPYHASRLSSGDIDAWQQPYLLLQFANWEVRRLGLADQDTPTTPVLDRVMDSHGIEGVGALLEAMGQTTSEGEALRLALGLDLASLDLVFGHYLAALLAVERQVTEWQTSGLVGLTAAPLAERAFDALLAEKSGEWRSQKDLAFKEWDNRNVYYSSAPLSRPVVERWERLDDSTIWAEVSYRDARWGVYGGHAIRRVEFFRQVDGSWRHASPDGRFLGKEVVLNSEHFRLECHEREVALMASGLARLETLYRQIADALPSQLSPGERLTIRIVPSASGNYESATQEIQVLSPYLSGWGGDWDVNYLTGQVSPSLLRELLLRAAGVRDVSAPDWPREIWLQGIISAWTWRHDISPLDAGDETPRFLTTEILASAARSDKLLPLSEMEQMSFGSSPPDWLQHKWDLFYQQVYAIMHYVGEVYGDQVLLSLAHSLPDAGSLASWLQTATRVDVGTFEEGWRAWLSEQVAP